MAQLKMTVPSDVTVLGSVEVADGVWLQPLGMEVEEPGIAL